MAGQCEESSDSVLLQMSMDELNKSVADFFTVCAQELSSRQP
jgi:hypothetical protein